MSARPQITVGDLRRYLERVDDSVPVVRNADETRHLSVAPGQPGVSVVNLDVCMGHLELDRNARL